MCSSEWPEDTALIPVMVGTDGVPRDLVVVQSSGPAYRESAMAAVRQWRYEPGRLNGKVVVLPALAEVRFRKAGVPPFDPEAASEREKREPPPDRAVEHPRLVHELEPDYPAALLGSGLEGTVLIRMTIGLDGVPQTSIVVKTSGPAFTESALAAVRDWRYEPGKLDGQPAVLPASAEVHFREPQVGRSARKPGVHTDTTDVKPTAEKRESESQRQPEKREVDFFGSGGTSRGHWPGRVHLRTDNFGLVSDWRQEDQLGQVLLALERARALFLHLYDQVPTGLVTVFVNQSLAESRTACQTSHGVGCYKSRGHSHSIILSRDALVRGASGPAVHEYTHLTQNLMGYDRAPAWVKEGIAGYYESVEFKKGKLYVGYFNPQRRIPGWLHVESLLAMDYGTMNSLG